MDSTNYPGPGDFYQAGPGWQAYIAPRVGVEYEERDPDYGGRRGDGLRQALVAKYGRVGHPLVALETEPDFESTQADRADRVESGDATA